MRTVRRTRGMAFRFRKSVKLGGGAKMNLSKSGIGYSWGVKGFRKTKKASGGTRTTYSIPGTGISYVKETGATTRRHNSMSRKSSHSNKWLWVIGWLLIFPLPLTILLLRKKEIKAPVKYGVLAVAWILYLIIVLAGGGGSKKDISTETASRSVPAEKNEVAVPAPIEVKSIHVQLSKDSLVLGETVKATAIISPQDADNKKITWTTSDKTVATVDQNGVIQAAGNGTASITVSTPNGVSSSVEISVDASKREMNLRVTHPRDDDNNIGDEWSYLEEINGEHPSSKMVLSVGDVLTCYAKFTESDENPDVGEASKTYTVTEEDIRKGFTITMDLYVTENGGRNKGKSAHFLVSFAFSPN